MTQFTEQTFTNGALVQRRVLDDVANTVTTFDGSGAQTGQRPITAVELAALGHQTQATNATTLIQKGAAAIAANLTYLAIVTPNNAQVVAQVNALTLQVNALMRLATQALNSTAGT